MNDRTTRIAFFLCGFAAFLNLYSTQGILHELAATFASARSARGRA
nr:hypothetical protein [Burkholderia cepacia]